MRNARPIHMHDLNIMREAIEKLVMARELFKLAGAKRTADAIRRAIKSASGAERHARGVLGRSLVNAAARHPGA